MLICRYAAPDGPAFGIVEDDVIYALRGDLNAGTRERGARVGTVRDLMLLAPIVPGKIVCVGRNYAAHARELGNEVPEEPLLFSKPASALLADGEPLVLPRGYERIDMEAELVVVIGRAGREFTRERAIDHVECFTL